jgi:hypothetical protein
VVDVYGNTSQRLQQRGKSSLIQPCDGVHGTCIVVFVNSLSVATYLTVEVETVFAGPGHVSM